ncbi:MAG: MerR family transcriptional regulator [Acidimicrobiales bacterium]
MRISELSQRAGVPVPTIKYYLREGLVPPGASRGRTQADYGDEHVERLRLIRTLIEVGGLAIADVRAVVAAVDDESLSLHAAFGVAHDAITPRHGLGDDGERAAAHKVIDDLVDTVGWQVRDESQARELLADALVMLSRRDLGPSPDDLLPAAAAAQTRARADLEAVPTDVARSEAVEYIVIGTLAGEVIANALRRLAQEHESSLRFDPPPDARRP